MKTQPENRKKKIDVVYWFDKVVGERLYKCAICALMHKQLGCT